MLGFQLGFFIFHFVIYIVECNRCVSLGNLYFNLLNDNHAIMQKRWYYQQEKCIFNMDLPFIELQQLLFMDFRNPMSSSCQRGDSCSVLPKFELLITFWLPIQDNSLLLSVITQTFVKFLCDDHLPPHGLRIQDAIYWACHSEITQGVT